MHSGLKSEVPADRNSVWHPPRRAPGCGYSAEGGGATLLQRAHRELVPGSVVAACETVGKQAHEPWPGRHAVRSFGDTVHAKAIPSSHGPKVMVFLLRATVKSTKVALDSRAASR